MYVYVSVCTSVHLMREMGLSSLLFPLVTVLEKPDYYWKHHSQCGNFPLWGVAEPNLTYCPLPLTLQRVAQLVGANESGSFALGVNVRQIGSHAGRVHNIVQGELSDQGILLEQQRQGLTNAASGAANGHLVVILQKNTHK